MDSIRESLHQISNNISVHRSASKCDLSSARFHFSSVVEDALTLLGEALREGRITLRREFLLEQEDDLVKMPRNPALQMVLNLLQNGIDAILRYGGSKEGWSGELFIRLAKRSPRELELLVQDNGCGIDSRLLRRVFEQGFTTKPGGSGFGLHFAGGFIQDQRGVLFIDSPGTGRGSTVRVRLPLSEYSTVE